MDLAKDCAFYFNFTDLPSCLTIATGGSMKILTVAVLLLVQYSVSSFAALGGNRKNLEVERSNLNVASPSQTTEGGNYSIITMQSVNSTITQYANANGQIFAVKWRGLHPPDLSVLLGSHFAEYQTARQNMVKAPGRQPLVVKTANIVVRHGGHMRDLQGLAYRMSYVPAGVNPEALP